MKISAILLGPIGLAGFPENAKPGIEGAIMSKEISSLFPYFSGSQSGSMISRNSTIEPGHPWIKINGIALGEEDFLKMKWISISSTFVL